ncbi:MAG: 5'/3'-nucleotidase SurE [Treponema sp.]|jgi:5'-nucleotidase|nr:5'/3'-nucleotidase SurE [Treponema sp.]
MNILLTNDDGIESEGIQKLALALRDEGKHDLYVIAPDGNRSGVSHSISFLYAPVRLREHSLNTWSCSGNPADCVMVATLGGLPVKPDLVLSGINRGANLGTDIVYSGTAAAARQAVLHGVPAIALSLAGNLSVREDEGAGYFWDMAVSFIMEKLPELIRMCAKDIFINMNIPNSRNGPLGMLSTYPCIQQYMDELSTMKAPDGQTYCFMKLGSASFRGEPGSDIEAVQRNYVSVSPIFVHPTAGSGLSSSSSFGVSPQEG